jgi:primosomal protein N'
MSVGVGMRVLVTFGRSKTYIGIVAKVHDVKPEGYQVKAITQVMDAAPIVLDPSKRYVEAAAYVPSGLYKANYVVILGTKDEILSAIRTDAFAIKLCKYYDDLTDLFLYG